MCLYLWTWMWVFFFMMEKRVNPSVILGLPRILLWFSGLSENLGNSNHLQTGKLSTSKDFRLTVESIISGKTPMTLCVWCGFRAWSSINMNLLFKTIFYCYCWTKQSRGCVPQISVRQHTDTCLFWVLSQACLISKRVKTSWLHWAKGTIVSTDVFYGIVYKKWSKPDLNLEIQDVVQMPEKTWG